MKYLVGLTPKEVAELKNREIALRNGCTGSISDGLGVIIKHPDREEYAIEVSDDYIDWLNDEEKQSLIPREVALIEGWIAEDKTIEE